MIVKGFAVQLYANQALAKNKSKFEFGQIFNSSKPSKKMIGQILVGVKEQ